ncbi:FAD-dependent oxidoreductase [Nocardia sp. ET3-3]|uniref:FAD-dependent oxidoreductase n=1 Tax=Nocardia terrae TaxID=2675851 RepID=A0A7K1V9U7_9NOCA|nr:FAD-dependent monooxygenase [Nocardia terrae]MVU83317.1 FAD-dependent oxidoreductase [Nocardia terrae]
MRNRTVLISGASIAGPALAYWLNRYGFAVTVVEKASALRPGGQAVDFTGETHHRVLERMGILAEVYARQTGKTDTVLVDETGEQVGFISGDFTGGDVEILRGDLSHIMYEKTWQSCEYIFGDSITALTETDDAMWVEFERSAPRRFDLVFGADGIHSRVRRLVFGPEKDFVQHQGHYYCVAGASPWTGTPAGQRERITSYGHNIAGRYAVSGGSKAQQMYLFASPEIDYARDDVGAQRRLVKQIFAEVGWRVPQMLDEMDNFDDFYLDAIAKVRKMKRFTRGRVALLGDAGYGNTLAGFGTGLAMVGAYVLAGELATAAGDHTVAFARYDNIMRKYAKISGDANAGRFLCPKTAWGLKFRNWFLGSKGMDMMMKMAEGSKNLELQDYPSLVGSHPMN